MFASVPATAQEPVSLDRGASDGIDRPIHDYSGEGDASSLELNPALLSAAKGLDFVLMGYKSTSPFTRGSGVGGFVSLNLGLGFATALGIQALRPGFTGNYFDVQRPQNPDFTKVSWGLSGGDGKIAALGLGVHWMLDGRTRLRRPDLDLGLLLRLRNHASLGAVARLGPADFAPDGPFAQELSVTGEVAIRPLGTRMLEVAGGLRARWRGDQVVPQQATEFLGVLPRARIALRYQGLEIAGEVEQVRAHILDRNTFQIASQAKAVRGGVALGLSWDFVSLRTGLHAGLSDGVDGFGMAAHFSSARQGRVFWPRLVDAERLDIAKISDEHSLIRMLTRIEHAEKAGARAVLLVDARGSGLGWASLYELRQALIRVRNAGGHVFAYVEDADLKDYYLASVAEQVYLHPAGELATFGLQATSLYFKQVLDRLGVAVEALHIDEYKSAHEPFTRTSPSAPDRSQREAYLDVVYDQVLGDIAQARGLDKATVKAAIDDAPHAPNTALQRRLVDKIVHRDEVIESISTAIGARVNFSTFEPTTPEQPTWSTAPYLAVVLIEGAIIDGDSRTSLLLGTHFTGSDTIVAQLRKLRGDPMCKGIVLRVNSPGGSALASDLIWREVSRTYDAATPSKDKVRSARRSPPIVVSMGDVAASGGYYVAMGAKQIFANPTTLTGSIGVVTLHFDLSGLLAKLGISTHTFQRGKNADITSLFKPFTADQRARMEGSIRRVYDLFRQRVSDGRGLTLDRVHELARGHVYAGREAKALGLVDEFGGLAEAIAAVKTRAGLPAGRTIDIRVLPRERRLLDLILEQVTPDRGDKGLRARVAARRAEKAELPLILRTTLARLPLTLLLLPPDQALTLLPGMLEVQ